MPHHVAYAWLEAEAQGFPVVSEEAFCLRPVALVRNAVGVLDHGTTGKLAEALEARLRPRAGGMSIEVQRQLRDGAWFPPGRLSVPLGEHLSNIAARYLEWRGHRVALRGDGDAPENAGRLRWLSLVLPADLLVAAFAARQGFEPPDETIRIVPPQLEKVLRKPCAETHLHVGAAVPFGLLWAARMRGLADEPMPYPRRSPGPAPPFGSPAKFRAMALTAATARVLLAAFLRLREARGSPGSFRAFVEESGYLPALARRLGWSFVNGDAYGALRRTMGHLANRGDPLPYDRARRLYRLLVGPRPTIRGVPALDIVAAQDPLASWLPVRAGIALPETRFAARSLAYLAGPGRDDAPFALFFWQYQRVRCLTYRYLVEEPGTAGLDWFTRHYSRISGLRGALEKLTYSAALRLQSTDLHLGALEARTSPPSFAAHRARWTSVRDEVLDLARQAALFRAPPGAGRPEVGLVLHFIKEWDHTTAAQGRQRSRMHADPRHAAFGCRFGPWFWERKQQALAIEAALRRYPQLLLVLRGIDVANVELAVPTWLLAGLFPGVRRASAEASARLARQRPEWQVPPLRTTLHAGEDYRRLVEGLRRIHEPFEHGLAAAGDRVGHGVALGQDPARWAEAAHTVPQPAEERLDDLLWELARYGRGELPPDIGRLERVRAEAVRLGYDIYRDEIAASADNLVAARRLRHDPAILSHLGYPFVRAREPRGAAGKLLFRYLTDAGVFERGQRQIEVRADASEVAMLRAAQRWLRGSLSCMDVVIESNPSSNLLIADLGTLDQHPVFRMQPLPSAPEPQEGSMLVSVNTDNPITFASCLADEFAHIHHALIRRGVPAAEAIGWLDRARQNGYRSRFTLRASAKEDELRALVGGRLTRR